HNQVKPSHDRVVFGYAIDSIDIIALHASAAHSVTPHRSSSSRDLPMRPTFRHGRGIKGIATVVNFMDRFGGGFARRGVDLQESRRSAVAESAMRPAKSPTTSWLAALALAALIATSGGLVAAQSAPDSENGRYAMTPIPEGVLRLDTRTGTMSTCTKNGAGLACYAVPDERAAFDAEVGRLQAEVEKLKGQLAAGPTVSGKVDEALPKS